MCDKIAKLLICVAAAALTSGAAAQQQAGAADCRMETASSGQVRTVLDGRTFVLADGREVRLAAIEVPSADRDAGAGASKAALAALIGGREISLKRLNHETDRYGRLLAHAFTADGERWVQQALLAAGHARVAARIGDIACATRLLAAERAARGARLGLWSDPSYAMRQADDPAGVLAERGRFTLVEGRVISVRESGGVIYVNFGRRWTEDFTATILRRSERTFSTAGMDLKRLAGRTVRLRGFVEERGGPWIEITRPEQIELLDESGGRRR